MSNTTKTTYHIEIASDHHEADEFCAWLSARGHDAKIGDSTGNYVDGVRTTDNDANEIMRALWDAYCNG